MQLSFEEWLIFAERLSDRDLEIFRFYTRPGEDGFLGNRTHEARERFRIGSETYKKILINLDKEAFVYEFLCMWSDVMNGLAH